MTEMAPAISHILRKPYSMLTKKPAAEAARPPICSTKENRERTLTRWDDGTIRFNRVFSATLPPPIKT